MAIRTSPKPSDGPLSAKGPTLRIGIQTTGGGTLNASIVTPDGSYLAIADIVLNAGGNAVVLSLPPGGVPPGSKLVLDIGEPSGSDTVIQYDLR